MKDVKWLFFDVGSTLVDETKSHQARVDRALQALRDMGKKVSGAEFWQVVTNAARMYQSPFRTAYAHFGITQWIPYCSELEVPYADAAKVLSQLHGRYAVGIIANQPEGMARRLEEYGLGGYVDICVSSAEAGVSKPDPAIFRLAFAQAGCRPEEAVMIGDRLDNDIFPAKALGIRTVRIRQGFTRVQQVLSGLYEPDFTVDTLTQLLPILDA